MYCERCNIDFQEGLRFCKWCGNTLTERRRVTSELQGCPSCAAPIQSNWVFCKACGVKLNAAPTGTGGEFCPRCGSKCDPDWLNCARCGEDLGRAKASKPVAAASAQGRQSLSHCSECGDQIEAGATYCKGCGSAVYAQSAAFGGASSLLCRLCNSSSPLGSTECRVCGTKFIEAGETIDISQGKISSTLPDLDERLPGSDSQTLIMRQVEGGENVISGAHTLIIGPSGEIEPLPLADELLQDADATETSFIAERPAGGSETTVLPGVAGSKSEQPSPTAIIGESRITGPVEEEPDEEAVEAEQVKAEKRESLSTQLDMPAINLAELAKTGQESNKPPAQAPEPFQPEPPANATIVMGSISVLDQDGVEPQESESREDETNALYREPLTAPFGLEPPVDERDTEPEFQAQQAQDETRAEDVTAQPQAATTAEFGGVEPSFVPPPTKVIAQPPAVAHETAIEQIDYPRVPATLPSQEQKKGTIIASIVVAVLVLAVTGFVIYWMVSGGSQIEPESPPQAAPAPPDPAPAPAAPPAAPAPPVAPEGMVYVPGGEYSIGRSDGDPLASPAHPVRLSAFFIDRTEVTNAEYKKFIDATGHSAPSDWKDGAYPDGRDNWPVTNVSWQDASAYAEWIGKRLPTEAEWEAAARGTDNRLYPWGNEWRPSYANVGTQGITDVGQYRDGASPVGALDMIGNVWELTADQFELYPGSTAKFPSTKKPGITYYVIRGGAFDGDKSNDATRRGFLEEDKGYPKTGFRLVKDVR